MNRYQTPIEVCEGIYGSVSLSYTNEWDEDDVRVVAERLSETLRRERAYLEAQRRGDVPARRPNPCGCSGS